MTDLEGRMWCVLDLDGDPLKTFPGDRRGWEAAVRFAQQQGGELDVVFMSYVSAA